MECRRVLGKRCETKPGPLPDPHPEDRDRKQTPALAPKKSIPGLGHEFGFGFRDGDRAGARVWSLTLIVVILMSLCFFPGTVLAKDKIYVYTEPDGVVRFSNKPPKGGQNAKVFQAKKSGFSWYRVSKRRRSTKLFKKEYSSIIKTIAKNRGVDEHLIRAVIHAESAFYPDAVSPKGALGLMQIMPFNLRRFGIKNPYDPYDNINGGSKYLSDLLKRYKGNVKYALAAYNAGENAVAKYKGIPPYKETQNYVRRVIELWKRYEKGDA